MDLISFLQEINDDVKTINSSEFKAIVSETQCVPSIEDTEITYENIGSKEKKCKLIKTCVLYIDIRKSTLLNHVHHRDTLVKLYSSFIRSMTKAAQYYGGSVKNIVGDRVMVVFPVEDCCYNAVKTAILFNTISKRIVNKYFIHNEVCCGIGIDYGDMLVSKVGTIKQGTDNSDYKSLVWLGKPANIASKLTDQACKSNSIFTPGPKLAYTPLAQNRLVNHTPPILMTEEVCLGYLKKQREIDLAKEAFLNLNLKRNYPELQLAPRLPKLRPLSPPDWVSMEIKIDGCDKKIYGGDVMIIDEMNKVR